MRASVLLLALDLLACASSPPPSPATPPVGPVEPPAKAAPAAQAPDCPRSTTLDPAGVREELVCLLRRYVRIDTTNPPGNELVAARFLKTVLAREGIDARIIESAPGRANLYARLKGTGQGKAVVLMHHMDVVPADAREWSVPPFSAALRDGFVWGRGALDNKGAGIVDLLTVLMLHRQQVRLPHDVIFLGVADEEAGGGLGARYLVEHHRELFADVGAVLNEGGAILQRGNGPAVYTVELAQKAPLWLRLTARGKSGHGSSPHPAAATHVLARALARLEAHRFPVTVLPEVQAVFTARARAMPKAERAPYLDLARSLQDDAFRERFLENPRDAALVRNTLSITQLGGGEKENVIPAAATAVLDLRLLPGQQPAAVIEELRRVIAEPAVEIETLLSWQAHSASRDTPLFRAIESLARERDPDSPVVANVIGGFTDCNAFRAAGMACYGFLPIRLTPADMAGLHGKDERIGVAQVAEAVVALSDLLRLPM
ncbi:MAG: M20/M25/M40 family metallo-hydrolase [Myxococcales bacterium]|jgi:acetylornithine deacetylase/succinyl-diaminopimelate desuccinylase-like protein